VHTSPLSIVDRLATAHLVRLGVDVIVAGTNMSTIAAMKATTTIPIVMTNSAEPVSAGLVASLARPGGNVTGFSSETGDEIYGKRLELLKETLPNLSRVGILWNPDFAPNLERLKSTRDAARPLGLTLVPAEARGLDPLEQAFATMIGERAQALTVLGDGVLFNCRDQIGVMAVRNRLPAVSAVSEYVEAGLLLSYGIDMRDQFRRSAIFVDKIFKGAKPADLPVELPDQPRAGDQFKDRKGARHHCATDTSHSRRRSDRIELLFSAEHESASGHF
jgi:putative ABC transport system substrate-binding protein